MIRPGQIYRVAVTVLQSRHPLTVRASIQRNGVEIGAASQDTKNGITESLIIKVGIILTLLNNK
jgi:hypothetical protein